MARFEGIRITDEEADAIKDMPPIVAQAYLKAKRCDLENGYDDVRAYLDSLGMTVVDGDPERGKRIAEFNDMVVQELHRRATEGWADA